MKFLFIFILLFSTIFSFKIKDIPLTMGPDRLIIPSDFDSKYPSFALVGENLRNRLLSNLSSLIKQKFPNSAFCLIPRIKLPFSLKRKMDLELKTKDFFGYLYKDFEDVKDFVRSSLIFSSKDEISEASGEIEDFFGEVLKKDNSFDIRTSPLGKAGTGYRDLSYNFAIKEDAFSLRINKTISPSNESDPYYMRFEVQVHLCGIFLAKQIGHLIYEMTRVLNLITIDNKFGKIIPDVHENEFLEIFEKIRRILPYDEESRKLIKVFEQWKNNKDDQNSIKDLVNKLNELSGKVYSRALQGDQGKCRENLKEIISNERCELRSEEELEKVSSSFVRELLK